MAYKYKIEGAPAYSFVEFELERGQSVLAEGGSMLYADGTVELQTGAKGGLMKGLKRKLAGDSFFMNTWTGPGRVAFSSGPPGDIIPLIVKPDGPGWILTKTAYICSAPAGNIIPSSKWGGLKSVIGREGAFLTYVTYNEEEGDGNEGICMAGAYGAIKKHEVPEGAEMVVDSGMFFATEETTKFKLSKVGGAKSFLLGGEGFVLRFFGPCTVLTQSRTLGFLVQYIAKRISR